MRDIKKKNFEFEELKKVKRIEIIELEAEKMKVERLVFDKENY